MRARTVLLPILAFCLTGCGVVLHGLIGGKNVTPCSPPGGVQMALAYPQPGATGIPDNIGEIAFASSSSMNSSYSAYLVDTTAGNTGTNFQGLLVVPQSSIPTPQATPPFSNATYEVSVNPGYVIPKGHQIGVYLNQSISGCTPLTLLGSFTAQ